METQIAYVKHEIHNGIATITFFHPKGNSFPTKQLQNLEKQLRELAKNERVKLIILQSHGENVFCAGASFEELIQLKNKSDAKDFFMGFAKVIVAMKECPKFIIGAIEGKVVGGGVGLVAACDYAIAYENASIKLSELSIGIGPFVIEPAIRRKMGLNALSELTLNPKEWKEAGWAHHNGLYNRVHANPNEWKEDLSKFCQELSQYSAEAMSDLKEIFWEGTNNWKDTMSERAKMSGDLILTEESKEILQQIIQK